VEGPSEPRAPISLWAITLSPLLVGASIAICQLLPPSESDPLVLRWLRLLAAHPGRSLIAVALLVWALHPPRKPILSR
jgi:hypothetical protein